MSTGTVTSSLVGGYRVLPEPCAILTHAAKVSKALSFRTCGRLYAYDTRLERLAQDLEHMAAALWQFVQEEHAMVRQRHVAQHRHLPAADQAYIRDRVMRRTTRTRGDEGGGVAGEAGDAVDVR